MRLTTQAATFVTMAIAHLLGGTALGGVTIQNSQGAFGNARFIGNTSGFATTGSTSSTSTPANVNIAGTGGSGLTSGGLGNNAGTIQYGSETTTVTVSATANEFRIHITGSGDMNAPSGLTGVTIQSSLSFFETAINITGSGAIPYTIQKTGDLAGVNWTLVPEPGSGASINAATLTAGSFRFDEGNSAPTVDAVYNFGNGGTGAQHRTFSGDFVVTIGGATTGVCCRGATCNPTVSQAACTASGAAGARFVTTSTTCNVAANNTSPCCYADYDKSDGLAVTDIFAYLTDWFALRPAAVLGGNGTTGTPVVQNIFSFLSAWFAGC